MSTRLDRLLGAAEPRRGKIEIDGCHVEQIGQSVKFACAHECGEFVGGTVVTADT
ncbi:hypothetical protein [Nocardia sp. CA-135398]|uniref:hypothetical protein n=1 Tax=Nocardia sp. CA-135398 TaxID=3239977 RepID=UPI003D9A076D